MVEATTQDISSNGLLFVTTSLPEIGSNIEFSMDMPSEVMGTATDVSIHCIGRVIRHDQSGQNLMAAAVIDQYFLKA